MYVSICRIVKYLIKLTVHSESASDGFMHTLPPALKERNSGSNMRGGSKRRGQHVREEERAHTRSTKRVEMICTGKGMREIDARYGTWNIWKRPQSGSDPDVCHDAYACM